MLLNSRFTYPQRRHSLQELIQIIRSREQTKTQKKTHSANQTLGILINGPIIRELQLVLQHTNIHIRMVVRPKWCLQKKKKTKKKQKKSQQSQLNSNFFTKKNSQSQSTSHTTSSQNSTNPPHSYTPTPESPLAPNTPQSHKTSSSNPHAPPADQATRARARPSDPASSRAGWQAAAPQAQRSRIRSHATRFGCCYWNWSCCCYWSGC